MKKYILPFLLVIATIAGVIAAFGTDAENPPPADDTTDIVFLGELDLAERAEIWRNQYRRMTPGDEPLVQDVGAWPAAWEEFGSHWGAAPAMRGLATWLVPFSVERTDGKTVIRDANGTVLWVGTTDFAKDESANVTLTGALVDEADWPLYDATQWEVLRRTGIYRTGFRDGEGGGTNNTPTNNPDNMFVSYAAVFTNDTPELRVGLKWTNDITLDIWVYAPVCTFETHEYVVTNDENMVVTNISEGWRSPRPVYTGLASGWEYAGTVSLTNGVETVFVDTNYMGNRWPIRFYAAFESLDFDGDGLNDVIEDILGISTNSVDHDQDGVDDLTELAAHVDPTFSNVWWLTTTTNIYNYWEYIGFNTVWTGPPNEKFSTNVVGVSPAEIRIVDDVRIHGYVDDMITVDCRAINTDGGPANFANYSISGILPSPQRGDFELKLFDYPAPGHSGHNEVRLGDSNGIPFRVIWNWRMPIAIQMEPALSETSPPLDNPSGIILGSNANFHVHVHPDLLVPDDKIVWTSVCHKVEFTPTNRGWNVSVCATNAGDDELLVSVEDAIGDFNLPPFHVKVMPITVVTAKVGVVNGPDGQSAVTEYYLNRAFNTANAILAQAGIQLELDLPVTTIGHDSLFWDVNCNTPEYLQLLSIIPDFGGMKVYFVNTLNSPDGGDSDGVNNTYGIVIACSDDSNGEPRDLGHILAHETCHACGLRDLYPNLHSEQLSADGAISEERMPCDWGNYRLVNNEDMPIAYFMQRLLMYWRGDNNDIPSGEVYGVWYSHGPNSTRIWHLTNAPVGLSGMTNVPPVHHYP